MIFGTSAEKSKGFDPDERPNVLLYGYILSFFYVPYRNTFGLLAEAAEPKFVESRSVNENDKNRSRKIVGTK